MNALRVRTVSLKIGELFTANKVVVVETILNSPCVAVCVFVPGTDVGGMVHFAMPSAPPTVDKRSQFNYGDLAVTALVKSLEEQSGKPSSTFSAKVIGGAKVPGTRPTKFNTGEQNIKIAKKVLTQFNIKVVGEDVGGESDRHAFFHVSGGRLQVAPLEKPTTTTMKSPLVSAATISAAKEEKKSAAEASDRKRKVLIVDDSKTIRDLLVRVLSEDTQLEIVGTATNPIEAQEMLKSVKPDVITLDIHMPEMTGVEWLEKLLPRMSIPVVMITSLQLQDGNEVFKALELGAVDYIQKPVLNEIKEMAPVIREKVKSASYAKVKSFRKRQVVAKSDIPLGTMDQSVIIAIGASTGGTEALKDVLIKLPKDIPPILIVQHIPAVFSKAFADRLNTICPFEVIEGKDGDEVKPGRVIVAAGGTQMAIEKSGKGYIVRVNDDAPVNRHKPSVDYLFHSMAQVVGGKSIGVILTGMGADGAKGLLEMKEKGSRTIGQDEDSCVVYGMPRSAAIIGAVEEVLPLDDISNALASKWPKKKAAA